MKIKLFIIAFLVLISPTISRAEPAFVQAGYYPDQCSSSSCDITFNIDSLSVTAGNLIVVGVRTDDEGGVVSSVTSNPGSQSCSEAIEQISQTAFWLDVWYCPNATGGSTTVTVNLTGTIGVGNRFAIAEYSGVATSSPVHGTPISAAGTSSTADAGDYTTTESNALLVLWAGTDGNDNFGPDATPPAGWSKPYLGPDPGDGADKFAMAYRVAATAGTYDAYFNNADDTWAAAAVAFEALGGESPSSAGGGSFGGTGTFR